MKDFMYEAMLEAKKAAKRGEVPIGAVLVIDDKIIARGRNRREKTQNALQHAEIMAIDRACRKRRSWRLDNATLYVTLEPCPMCAGAIANARIQRVIYACKEKTGEDDLCRTILQSKRLNHKVEIEQGSYEIESAAMLTNFFKTKRKK